MIRRIPTIAITGARDGASPDEAQKALIEGAGRCIANAGCNLLTETGSTAAELVAKAFCETPYRVGSSIGIVRADATVPGRVSAATIKRSRRPAADFFGAWIDIRLSTHSLDNSLLASSCDIMIVLPGQGIVDVPVGKPVIAMLSRGQKSPSFAGLSPEGTTVVKNETALAECLASHLAPLAISRPTFNKLKNAYKTDAGSIHRCTMSFPNTCAIRMSEALDKVVPTITDKFKASGLNVCPHNFMRGAQDLASVLRQANVFGVYDQGFEAPGTAPGDVIGKKGIVCYMNIPTYPDGQGHIDLWDGAGPVGSAYWSGDPIWFWHLT